MTGCWEWSGVIQPAGYGQLQVGENRGILAHRAVWELLHGKLKPEHELHHVCCNKRCVNPTHLMAVTASEHMRIETRGYCKRKWFGGNCPTCDSPRVSARNGGSGFRCKDCDARNHKKRKAALREGRVA